MIDPDLPLLLPPDAEPGVSGHGLAASTPVKPSTVFPGFYRLTQTERRAWVARLSGLSEEEMRILSGEEGLQAEQANHMVENALGVIGVPLGVCVNLLVDGEERIVPMAVEEASVIAAASHAAKLLRAGGGIRTQVALSKMVGQIQLLDVPDPVAAERAIFEASRDLLRAADTCDPCLIRAGGGALSLEVRHLPPLPGDPVGPMMIVHLVVDVREAMGANTVNSMCERLAPEIERLSGGRVLLRIITNLADQRTVVAEGKVPLASLARQDAETLARGIEAASVFAERDPYRAATHNKGIMNGVDAVLLAFGQDWRAVEAGAHAYAARSGRYTALARWRVDGDALSGRLELPLPVGVIGGVTAVHPTYRVARAMAQVTTAAELASLVASVGLAQNLGALRALAAEGIQRGHMRVHARNLAVASGAVDHEVDRVACTIAHQGAVSLEAAREALHVARSQACRGAPLGPPQIRQRFDELRERHLPSILALIDELLREATGTASSLFSMCSYHLGTGGKRLRALLPLIVADTLGMDPKRLVPFGAACELLHNATLVHDDLQDGDRLRRGRETVWHRFGVPQAINLGDAMFYYTLLALQRLEVPLARREAIARRAIKETLRVLDGQERELLLRRSTRPTLGDYFSMVEGKTSGLFALPLAGAAALCGLEGRQIAALEEAARHMGVLFQIQDDLLDLCGDKGRGSQANDLREGKRSLLVVHTLENAPIEEARWLRGVLDQDRAATTSDEIQAAMELLTRTGSIQVALRAIGERSRRASAALRLVEHPHLASVVEAMCDLFLEPIRPVMARYSARA